MTTITTTVKITINDKVIELNDSEAKELRDKLLELFPKNDWTIPIYPMPTYPEPTYPDPTWTDTQPYTTPITPTWPNNSPIPPFPIDEFWCQAPVP